MNRARDVSGRDLGRDPGRGKRWGGVETEEMKVGRSDFREKN